MEKGGGGYSFDSRPGHHNDFEDLSVKMESFFIVLDLHWDFLASLGDGRTLTAVRYRHVEIREVGFCIEEVLLDGTGRGGSGCRDFQPAVPGRAGETESFSPPFSRLSRSLPASAFSGSGKNWSRNRRRRWPNKGVCRLF